MTEDTVHGKIVPTRWRDAEGRWFYVAETEDEVFAIFTDGPDGLPTAP